MKNKTRLARIVGMVWVVWVAPNLYEAILNIFRVLPKSEMLNKLISDPPKNYTNTIEFLSPFISNIHYIVYGHLLFYLFSAVVGLYFLNYHRWALQFLNVLVLINIAFWSLILWLGFGFSAAVTADGHSLRHGNWAFVVVICGIFFWSTFVFLLRTRKVKDAFK